ncbi:hypothetical protein [Sphaerisporangium rhizosphaerae]|uniref:Uncharacterized protein n=1 Tax=Sphaerisporangium rhizosphaerae TaxID=2269375 RepID=A0ABW2NYP1_9ACTN
MAYKPPFTRAPGGASPAGPATLRRATPSLVLRELHAAMPEQAYGLRGMPVPDPGERVADIARGPASGDRRMTTAVAQVGEWLGLGGSILANLFNNHIIDDPTAIMDLPRPAPY